MWRYLHNRRTAMGYVNRQIRMHKVDYAIRIDRYRFCNDANWSITIVEC